MNCIFKALNTSSTIEATNALKNIISTYSDEDIGEKVANFERNIYILSSDSTEFWAKKWNPLHWKV